MVQQSSKLALCAPLLRLCVLCGQPLQPRGEGRAKPAGMVGVGCVWLAGISSLSACPDWGQRERLLRLRFMRTGVCGAGIECCRTDILLAHPALSSAARPPPKPSVLALSELLIVLMNILEASRNGSSGLGGFGYKGPDS